MSNQKRIKRNKSSKYAKRAKAKFKPGAEANLAAYRPRKISAKKIVAEKKKSDGSGPLEWILPMMEETYTPLAAQGAGAQPLAAVAASSLRAGERADMAASAPTVWRDVFVEYKQCKAACVVPPPVVAPAAAGAAPAPFVPGARNWLPLGPSVVMDGQTVGSQPVSGRVSGLAIAADGAVVYAATANGGVFRSADGGTTWRALMDRFDLNPTSFASASLACGAIALDPADPNRVYVGTGEGDTLQLFRSRVVAALPAYRGVGILRTDDGGISWIPEASSPDLAGEAFFALAVDPHNRENVIGATTAGLYRRVQIAGGQIQWTRVRPGVHSSVVAVSNGAGTRFFCAEWGQSGAPSSILHSDDAGKTWSNTGSGFPATNVGRIALGVQTENPNLVYAFAAAPNGSLSGVFRLNGIAQPWKRVSAVPNVLPGGQGSYDLTIAVDPENANLIYLGGDRMDSPPWGGSIWRCMVKVSGSAYRVSSAASIGTHAHADIHYICHTPAEPNELWCACDGGVFLNRNPKGNGEFVSQNSGLACLCCNFIAQHPTDPNILFTGLQDNGTARTASGAIWKHVGGGDGGYCLINWANPNRVLIYMNGTVYRSTTGGTSHAGWTPVWDFGWATMTQPIVGVPRNPSQPASANIVAVGAGSLVYLSSNFADSWLAPITIPGGTAAGEVFALAFASPRRLFIGTTRGQVFRADRSGNTWGVTRLDNAAAGPLGVVGVITDVAVDWSDANGRSIFVAFGGMGDRRRVWRFDGTRWQARSGSGTQRLLDVEHNALAIDRIAPNNVYVGADIGVWHSADSGVSWNPLENGLPDAPVFDLQIHPTQRLLRAATHGRGVYEISL
jgi:photosystem II stability/assembly factor-like uncharacterized protein